MKTYIFNLVNYYYHSFVRVLQTISSVCQCVSIAEKKHQCLCIPYIHEGRRYVVYVPYERKCMNRMINTNIEMIYDEKTIKLEQQPGVPYLISPKHLGAKYAKVYSMDNVKLVEANDRIEV